jgi:hypothetical protein
LGISESSLKHVQRISFEADTSGKSGSIFLTSEGNMQGNITKRNWWVVLVVGGVLAVAVALVQQSLLPQYDFAAFLIIFVILGVTFYWVYTLDKVELWWALIPALAMGAILATGIVAYFTPKDASGSSPYGVVTLGLAAALMGLILRQPTVKLVMYCIAIITLLVGDLMLPIDLIWQIVFIVVELLVVGYLLMRAYRQVKKT